MQLQLVLCSRARWLLLAGLLRSIHSHSPTPHLSSPPLLLHPTCSNLGYTYDDLEQFEALAAAGNEGNIGDRVVALYPLEPIGEGTFGWLVWWKDADCL